MAARAVAVAVGVTTLALLLTSWLRSFMPYRFWRVIHYLSFVAFALVTAHGLLAGSDANEVWMRAIYVGSVSACAFVALVRLLGGPRKPFSAKAAKDPKAARVPQTTRR